MNRQRCGKERGDLESGVVKGRQRRHGTASEWLGLATTAGTDAGVGVRRGGEE